MLKTKLIMALSLAALAGAAQALPKDIVFDGYCDGLHLGKKTADGGYNGYRTGCASDLAGGGAAGKNAAITYDYATLGIQLTLVVRPDNTWTYYYLDGSVLNSGTWTAGMPAIAAQGAKSSLGK